MNSFEQQLTEGLATHIHSYFYAPEDRSFEMVVFHDPNSPRNFRTIHSDHIEEYQDILIDDDDPDLTDGIIGASQRIIEYGKVETVFHTDLREITFVSRCVPTIRKTEQDSAGQAANYPVVEPEGGDKPQPEAEGRSRIGLPCLDVRQKNI